MMFGIVLLHEILHYGPRLKEPYGLSVGKGVRECWDSSVGIDLEKPGFLLSVLHDVDLVDFVWQPLAMF